MEKKKARHMELEVFGCLNNDISSDILSRLPTQALNQLKSVSKGWDSLISDPSFISTHLKREEFNLCGFFYQENYQWCTDDIRSISYVPVIKEGEINQTVFEFISEEDVTVLSTSYGLICCRSAMPVPDPVIYICNPLNQNLLTIEWESPDIRDSIGLAFDPFQNPIDVSTKFKVVKAHKIEAIQKSYFSFHIYDSETTEWRTSKEICHCCCHLFKNKGIYIKGILHWLTTGDQVMTFDVENELSWLLPGPFPTTAFQSIPEICIGESKGKLHYIMVSDVGFHVWVIEDYYEAKWALEYSINLEKLEEENPQILCGAKEMLANRVDINTDAWLEPLAYKDGILFMRVSVNIYLYHFLTGKLDLLCSVSDLGLKSMYFPTVLPYTMSLVPLKKKQGLASA